MVYLLLADGFEEIEALAPLDFLRRCGVKVVTLSMNGSESVIGAHGIPVTADLRVEDAAFSDAQMVILPGGMPGTEHLDRHPMADGILKTVSSRGGFLCAICAAPSVLGKRGYLAGKEAICYPGFESALSGARLSEKPVVRDGNVITGKAAGVAWQFAYACASVLVDGGVCDRVADGLFMRDGK